MYYSNGSLNCFTAQHSSSHTIGLKGFTDGPLRCSKKAQSYKFWLFPQILRWGHGEKFKKPCHSQCSPACERCKTIDSHPALQITDP